MHVRVMTSVLAPGMQGGMSRSNTDDTYHSMVFSIAWCFPSGMDSMRSYPLCRVPLICLFTADPHQGLMMYLLDAQEVPGKQEFDDDSAS